jgi:hypothetical protein
MQAVYPREALRAGYCSYASAVMFTSKVATGAIIVLGLDTAAAGYGIGRAARHFAASTIRPDAES